MANNSPSSIDLVSMDFDFLKRSFKQFLSQQDVWKDYNLDGSNISVLLDLLAYNTQKNVFYLNMDFAEGFLDSAQLKESVISHAKSLNYCPRSARSAKARVRLTWTATAENQPYIIRKGTSFTAYIKNDSFQFTIPETLIVSSETNEFSVETDIYEGIYVKDSYVYQTAISNPRFRLSNRDIDTRSLTVTVKEDGETNGQTYILKTSLLDLNSNSKSFFLQAAENGYYEILFGDNVIGRQPKNGAIIECEYRITKGERANGARQFWANFDPTATVDGLSTELTNVPTTTTLQDADAGAYSESTESIRYYAPRHFQAQERAIVAADYESALRERFPEISAVSVFGGEELDPPKYGRVFVVVDLADVNGLPESKKDEYYAFIRARSPLKPVFIDPKFTYLAVNSIVRYNVNITPTSPTTIATLVKNIISQYNDEFLGTFGYQYRHSPFVTMIDTVDQSIISNETETNVYKKIAPTPLVSENMVIEYGIPIEDDGGYLDSSHSATERHAVWSSPFYYNGIRVILEDDGNGILRLVKSDNVTHNSVIDIGTVDYAKGTLSLINFVTTDYEGDAINIYMRPASADVLVPKDTIVEIEPHAVEVYVEPIKE